MAVRISCGVGFPNWNPQSEFISDEEKQEFQDYLVDGIPALYFCLLVKGPLK